MRRRLSEERAAWSPMRRLLHGVRDGNVSWTTFVRRTDSDWTKLAAKLRRRFKVMPVAVTVDDVRQELLLGAWLMLGKWTEDGGQPIDSYVIVGAHYRAARWLNKQRGAARYSSRAPSRFPGLLLDAVRGDEPRAESDVVDLIIQFEPAQETLVSIGEAADGAISEAKDQRDRTCVMAIFEACGDVDVAAQLLYSDPTRKRVCRFNSEKHVRRAVRRAVQRTVIQQGTSR